MNKYRVFLTVKCRACGAVVTNEQKPVADPNDATALMDESYSHTCVFDRYELILGKADVIGVRVEFEPNPPVTP